MEPLKPKHHLGNCGQIPAKLTTCIHGKNPQLRSSGVNCRQVDRHRLLSGTAATVLALIARGRLSRTPEPSPAGTLALLAPREFGCRRLERVQQQKCVLRGLVHVAEGATAHMPVQWRRETRRRHLSLLRPTLMRNAHAYVQGRRPSSGGGAPGGGGSPRLQVVSRCTWNV